MNYEKKYKEAQKWIESIYSELSHEQQMEAEAFFPELKESEDERIRKSIIKFLIDVNNGAYTKSELEIASWIAWLEKQGESKSAGKMQVSEKLYEHIRNTCACIDDALSSETLADVKDYLSQANYDAQSAFDMIEKQGEQKPTEKVEPKFKVRDCITDGILVCEIESIDETCYYCDYTNFDIKDQDKWKLVEQGEQKPADREFTFKAIPRLLEMIEPTNRAKEYCQKLIDSLIKEGYVIDAMIVGECLKQMNGEDVPMATMDEQKPTNKVEPFDKYEGLTDFERTLADICTGWIGEEIGWKEYIKDNANVLLKIAIKKFNSVQDASFEQKSAWSKEDTFKVQRICKYLDEAKKYYADITEVRDCIDWLKSIKERIGGNV